MEDLVTEWLEIKRELCEKVVFFYAAMNTKMSCVQ